MHNDFHSDKGRVERARRAESENEVRPMADREVPLHPRKGMAPVIHEWLDGEVPEAAVRQAVGERELKFWRALDTDLQAKRQVRAPMSLEQAIMKALPQNTPAIITPWHLRPIEVPPVVAIGGAATLLVLGLTVGMLVAK